MKTVHEIVADLIAKTGPTAKEMDLHDNTELMASGLLNSLAIVRLVSELESVYAVRIPFREIGKENFSSIGAIERMLSRSGAALG